MQRPWQIVWVARMTYQGLSEHMRYIKRHPKPTQAGKPGALRYATPAKFFRLVWGDRSVLRM